MTLIVSPDLFPSKKGLKIALDAGCRIWNPSIMGEWMRQSTELPVGFEGIVTNHPKRTKFAKIWKGPDGWKVT